MTMDPVILAAVRWGLASLLFAAGVHKLRDPHAFGDVLRNYAVVPAAAVASLAVAVPAAEAVIALALLVPATAAAGALLAALLLTVYSAALAVNLALGRRDFDCGCAAAGSGGAGPGLLVRNAVIVAAALAAALPPSAREFGPVDAATVAFSLVTVGFTAAAVSVLARERVANAALRRRS